ncbi:MAG: exodeoxyribonuclease VII small subunit [Acholeplasmatales bacterium]|nr:exodeoxyribonuclease VII small subunit [Acholeplasmatales bacterium]
MENKEQSFESLMTELEETVKNLEKTDISLDDAVKSYSKGLELSKKLYEILDKNKTLVTQKMTDQGLEDFKEEN